MASRKEIVNRIGIAVFVGILPFVLILLILRVLEGYVDSFPVRERSQVLGILIFGSVVFMSFLPAVGFALLRRIQGLAKALLLAEGMLLILMTACASLPNLSWPL